MITTEKEAREFLRGCFESYNVRDWDRFFDKYVWESCLFFNGDGLHTGRETMIQFWENYYKTKRETLMEPTNVFVKENEIAVEYKTRFHFLEDEFFSGMQFKKGDEILLKCADFYKIRDGKIYEFIVYRFTPWWIKKWEGHLEEFEKIVDHA